MLGRDVADGIHRIEDAHTNWYLSFTEMSAMGALWVKGCDSVCGYKAGDVLDVTGRPQAVFTPGHTHGHCSLLRRDRGAAADLVFARVSPRRSHTPRHV